ncbi:MAG: hypothetical protein KF836_08325 [Fimbriimonadaceae bacterium]|nr:hypothetical protein [Fimbriimonadaceae bacterium]
MEEQLRRAWLEAQISNDPNSLSQRYKAVPQALIEPVLTYLCFDMPPVGEDDSYLDFKWLFGLGRKLQSRVSSPKSLAVYNPQTFSLVEFIRDGLEALGYIDLLCNSESRIDWYEPCDVWDYWITTLSKIKFNDADDYFSAAERRAREDKGNLEINVDHQRIDNPEMREKMQLLLKVAIYLSQLTGSTTFAFPTERIGRMFDSNLSPVAQRKRGSRYIDILKEIGALECTDSRYSKDSGKAKEYQLCGEGTIWYLYHP